jgi:hypothetical protein
MVDDGGLTLPSPDREEGVLVPAVEEGLDSRLVLIVQLLAGSVVVLVDVPKPHGVLDSAGHKDRHVVVREDRRWETQHGCYTVEGPTPWRMSHLWESAASGLRESKRVKGFRFRLIRYYGVCT